MIPPIGRRPICNWLAAGVALTVALLIGWLLWRLGSRPSDFSQDFYAARALRLGDSIYGPSVRRLALQELGRPGPSNFHPPTVAVLFLPLSLLSHRAAFLALGLLQAGSFAAAVSLAARRLGAPADGYRLALAGLLWWPPWACLTHGQISMLVAVAVTFAWLEDDRGKQASAGALVGLASLLKLFPAVLALYFLVRGRWRALLAMLAVCLAGGLFTLLVIGLDDFGRYWTEAIPTVRRGWTGHPLNVSLHGAAQTLFGQPIVERSGPTLSSQWVANAVWVVGLTIVVVSVAAGLRRCRMEDWRFFSTLNIASLLLSPVSWSHTLTAAVVPLLALWAGVQRRWLTLLPIAYLTIGQPGSKLGQLVALRWGSDPYPPQILAIFTAPTLGLLVLWCWLVGRRPPTSRPDGETLSAPATDWDSDSPILRPEEADIRREGPRGGRTRSRSVTRTAALEASQTVG